MKLLEVGYNLVERESIGKKYEEFQELMSIVQFLRNLRSQTNIPRKVAVSGLDKLLLQGEETTAYVRRTLSNASDYLISKSFTIQFIIEGRLTIDREPKIRMLDKEIRLRPIFGDRLVVRDVDWFYSPFNI
jgi:hypothetical protein